jgi:Uncharacterized conserved protein
LTEQHESTVARPEPIEKVSIIVSKGSLEGIYPALIMANGARMEGIEANLFFTFFGLDAINKAKHEHVKVSRPSATRACTSPPGPVASRASRHWSRTNWRRRWRSSTSRRSPSSSR